RSAQYERLARDIDAALRFMHACGADMGPTRQAEFFTSHEALLLDYESSLTRIDPRFGQRYDLSGHMVWIGERTRPLDGPHIEFASRIRNPVGVKLGPSTTPEQLRGLIGRLDPHREA